MQRLPGMTGLIRYTIQLKSIYSICQTLCSWPAVASPPAFPTEESRSRLYLCGCRTSAHRRRITGRRPRSKSRSCTTKLPTSERILHKSSKDPSKSHAVVFGEDLSIRNMSKSESGTQENHGKTVKQKSGLNRETRRNSLPSGPSGSGGSQEMAETPAVLFHESPGPPPPVDRSRRYTRILVILFLCTLPLVNPIVHGDGVGYYAYVRAPLI